MLSQKELLDEISDIVIKRIDEGLTTESIHLAEQIIGLHPIPGGPGDGDFYELCAYQHVRLSIRMVLRDYKLVSEKPDPQLVLPGFSYVQKAYAVERDEEPCIIPISKMSREQLLAKESELKQMADGCRKHAAELKRFRLDKFGF
ncbi:MAG TPA: hypothetical protein VGF16_16715 [Bryobacteraceae bacterium]|jgi:hypothetical protein